VSLFALNSRRLHVATLAERYGRQVALNGIDGLYFDRGTLIAVENGTSPDRVVAFTADPSVTRIASETIIERSTGTPL